MEPESSQIYRMEFSSNDHEDFISKMTVAEAQQSVLEGGSFKATASLLVSKRVGINRFEINRKVFQEGVSSTGFITFTLFEPSSLFQWRNHEMSGGMIGVLWNREHVSVSGSHFKAHPVSIKQEYFETKCEALGYPEIYAAVQKSELISVPKYELQMIRLKIEHLLDSRDFGQRQLLFLLENDLVESLILCLAKKLATQRRDEIQTGKFKSVVENINSNLSEFTSISQICQKNGVTERSLRRWFQQRYQMSPKKYLRTMRLNEVRRQLKKSNPGEQIFQIASEFNFWHMGQFGKDYKQLFNELPSDTCFKKMNNVFHFPMLDRT